MGVNTKGTECAKMRVNTEMGVKAQSAHRSQ